MGHAGASEAAWKPLMPPATHETSVKPLESRMDPARADLCPVLQKIRKASRGSSSP